MVARSSRSASVSSIQRFSLACSFSRVGSSLFSSSSMRCFVSSMSTSMCSSLFLRSLSTRSRGSDIWYRRLIGNGAGLDDISETEWRMSCPGPLGPPPSPIFCPMASRQSNMRRRYSVSLNPADGLPDLNSVPHFGQLAELSAAIEWQLLHAITSMTPVNSSLQWGQRESSGLTPALQLEQ